MKTHLNCPCGEAIVGTDEDELVEKKIIPQDVYDKIKDKIIAKQAPEKKK